MTRPVDALQPGAALPTYTLPARNTAAESENRIHADDVAARYGFRGGLVPGVTVYAYLTHPIVAAFGIEWLGRGSSTVRFLEPVYDGETTIVTGTVQSASDEETVLALEARDDSGRLCAVATATLPNGECGQPPAISDYPRARLRQPDERRPVSRESLEAIDTLGTVDLLLDEAARRDYLADVDESLPLYDEHRIAHLAHYQHLANSSLSSNVRLDPWMHVSTDTTHYSLLREDERVSVRGRVADLFERKGHHFVDLDLLFVANDERPVAHLLHRSIYRIKPKA